MLSFGWVTLFKVSWRAILMFVVRHHPTLQVCFFQNILQFPFLFTDSNVFIRINKTTVFQTMTAVPATAKS